MENYCKNAMPIKQGFQTSLMIKKIGKINVILKLKAVEIFHNFIWKVIEKHIFPSMFEIILFIDINWNRLKTSIV